MIYKCIFGTKVGDSLLRNEDGKLISVFPDEFYKSGSRGYWLLKRHRNWWKILRVEIR